MNINAKILNKILAIRSQKEKHEYSILMHIYGIRKMVTITLYVRLQKRHRCMEQCFVLCGRGRGLDDLEEWH